MTSSSGVIQSYYFYLGPVHLTYYHFLSIQHFITKISDKDDLICSSKSSSEARGARWATHCSFLHGLEIQGFALNGEWCNSRTSLVLPLHWLCRITYGLDDLWAWQCLPEAKAWLNVSSEASRPTPAAGLARLGWDCSGLRCAWLAAAARKLCQKQASDWVMRINKISPMCLEAESKICWYNQNKIFMCWCK